MKKTGKSIGAEFKTQLAARGLRPTPQQVFLRAKQTMPEISMATVYNCLGALLQCRLVREVNLDRGAKRYCPNMTEHLHFYCDECGGVYDIDYAASTRKTEFGLPRGFRATAYEVSIHGACSECAARPPGGKKQQKAPKQPRRPSEIA